jgi:hypothetical protein
MKQKLSKALHKKVNSRWFWTPMAACPSAFRLGGRRCGSLPRHAGRLVGCLPASRRPPRALPSTLSPSRLITSLLVVCVLALSGACSDDGKTNTDAAVQRDAAGDLVAKRDANGDASVDLSIVDQSTDQSRDAPAVFDMAPDATPADIALDSTSADSTQDVGAHDVGAQDVGGKRDQTVDITSIDLVARDAGNDSSPVNLGPVQCRIDSDCGSTLTCQRSAPGGVCLGCGLSCPQTMDCVAGACVRSCSNDQQCNAGFRCGGTGKCILRSCDSSNPCPGPYVCSGSGRCERPTCPGGGSCPAPLQCVLDRCVEP